MKEDDIKIEELRLLFERENLRKQSLENKASYFLGCISIIVTLICTFSKSITSNKLFTIPIKLGVIIYFLVSLGFCISIFLPRHYYHPFNLDDYEKLESNFKNNNDFKEKLVKQYLISIHKNYEINEKVVKNFRYSVFYFISFLIIFLIMEVSL